MEKHLNLMRVGTQKLSHRARPHPSPLPHVGEGAEARIDPLSRLRERAGVRAAEDITPS